MEEVLKCARCEQLEAVIKEKDDEIQKMKMKVHNLKKFLENYCKKTKLYLRSSFGSSKDSTYDCNYCHDEPLINVSGQENGKISHSGSILTTNEDDNKDYVYDETLNMHYCLSTGYYYDTKSELFYIPENDAYYKFDYNKNEYEFVKREEPTSKINTTENCESVVDKVGSLNLKDEEESSVLNSSSVQEVCNLDETYNCEKDSINEELKSETKQEINDINESSNDWQPPDGSNTTIGDLVREVAEQNSGMSNYNYDEKSQMYYSKSTGCLNDENDIKELSNDWQPSEGSNTTVGDLVREVAEQNSGMSDYIYDEKSQMYYSKSTGYFYDPIRKLLYDPKHKIYYLYDQEKMSYDFYCHADSTDMPSPAKVLSEVSQRKSNQAKKVHKVKRKSKGKKLKNEEDSEILTITVDSSSSTEDGEVFSTDSDSSQNMEDEIEQDPTSRLPCIRAIVESSHRIKYGTLILITCTGGVLGRSKPSSINVPDITVSKVHARVTFCYDTNDFSIEDLGSQNGTFVNEKRLSEPKYKSHPHNLKHGDKLFLGSCKMLIHVHNGHETCDKCEPGQVMAEIALQEANVTKEVQVLKTKEEREKERRKVLKNMKKKYGLGGMDYPSERSTNSSVSKGYEDKAEIRRKTVGSQNPYEKTQTASLDESVSNSNKGYQMLKKLGWKDGESLGTTGTGILDPIIPEPWFSKAGLGSSKAKSKCAPLDSDKRNMRWVKAQERYNKITSCESSQG